MRGRTQLHWLTFLAMPFNEQLDGNSRGRFCAAAVRRRRCLNSLAWGHFKGSKMMANVEDYDIVVLGSGTAGKPLAWTLGSEGTRVAVIERKYVGGACPNIACLPSKNLVHSAKVASYFH